MSAAYLETVERTSVILFLAAVAKTLAAFLPLRGIKPLSAVAVRHISTRPCYPDHATLNDMSNLLRLLRLICGLSLACAMALGVASVRPSLITTDPNALAEPDADGAALNVHLGASTPLRDNRALLRVRAYRSLTSWPNSAWSINYETVRH